LEAFEIVVIPGHQDHPASLLAGDLSQRKTIFGRRLSDVDDHDVVIVFVERAAHFTSSFDGRKKVTLVLDNVGEQIADMIVIFHNQHFADARHFVPLYLAAIIRSEHRHPRRSASYCRAYIMA
jgi:hypothetical protein